MVVAEEPRLAQVDTAVTLMATPFDPTFSVLSAEFPAAAFGAQGLLAQTRLRTWYFATSPYFWPMTFYEIGAEGLIGLGDPAEPWLSLGVGTAFSQVAGIISIPLVMELSGDFRFGPGFALLPSLQGLLYGNGLILQLDARTKISLDEHGPYLVVGGYVEATMEFGLGGGVFQYGLLYGVGTKW
jgi:hypothetical protein